MKEPSAPIASSSSLNTKSQRTPKKHKGKKSQQDKVVSSPKPIAPTVNATPPSHIRPTSQGKGSSSVVPAPAASDEDDDDEDRDDGIELADFGDFDYDAVKADDGAELWLVRAPSTLKARNLRGLEIDSSRTGLVGDLLRKGTTYNLWTLDPPASAAAASGAHVSKSGSWDLGGGGRGATSSLGAQTQEVGVGAEELNGLSVLLPRKRKGGGLYLVQKPITRHLVVAARPAKPARPEVAHEPPKREAYPDEVLTHRFRPYGDPGDLPVEHRMDVEMVEASSSVKEKEKPKRRAGETGSSKKKKPKLGA